MSVQSWVPTWPPQDSCTWRGRVVWMFAMQAGWQTGVSATPSTLPDHSVGVAYWECVPSICFPIRPATPSQTPAMMLFATLVQKSTLSFMNVYPHTHIFVIVLSLLIQ